MYSINFPKMFSNSYTNLLSDYDATLNNLKMLLYSDKYSLLGDPYYGTNIKRMLYNQNGTLLKDILIDDIFSAIVNFMPQIRVDRKDIEVKQDKQKIWVAIRCTNMIDYTTNLYEIQLITAE